MIRCVGAWGGERAEEIPSLRGGVDGILRYSGRGGGGTVEWSGRRLCGWEEGAPVVVSYLYNQAGGSSTFEVRGRVRRRPWDPGRFVLVP